MDIKLSGKVSLDFSQPRELQTFLERLLRLDFLSKIGYVCTGGGALIRLLSGMRLPLLEAMEKNYQRWQNG